MNTKPSLVWLPADHRLLGEGAYPMPFLVLGDKYARAVKTQVQAQPVLFPLCDADQIDSLLPLVDGVLLTGSPSNVHPSHFDASVLDSRLPLDPPRDSLTLRLVRACLEHAVPLLGICRGFQEMNVALGGSLHQSVHTLPGMLDHRDPHDASPDVQYAPSHRVDLLAGSCLAQWAGADQAMVNSLHGQGVDRLAQGLRALAFAPDGLIEAFEVVGAKSFALGVQWHPEWKPEQQRLYAALFAAFAQACQARAASRKNGN